MRVSTYGLTQKPKISTYVETVLTAPGVADWIAAALLEEDFLDFEEPHRLSRIQK